MQTLNNILTVQEAPAPETKIDNNWSGSAGRWGKKQYQTPIFEEAPAPNFIPPTPHKSKIPKPMQKVQNLVKKYADMYNVDNALALALVESESSGNHINPKTGKTLKSSTGALGLMQVTKDTAKLRGVDDVYNIEKNVQAGMAEIAHWTQVYDGDVDKAIAKYKGHGTNVEKAAPKIANVKALMRKYQPPQPDKIDPALQKSKGVSTLDTGNQSDAPLPQEAPAPIEWSGSAHTYDASDATLYVKKSAKESFEVFKSYAKGFKTGFALEKDNSVSWGDATPKQQGEKIGEYAGIGALALLTYSTAGANLATLTVFKALTPVVQERVIAATAAVLYTAAQGAVRKTPPAETLKAMPPEILGWVVPVIGAHNLHTMIGTVKKSWLTTQARKPKGEFNFEKTLKNEFERPMFGEVSVPSTPTPKNIISPAATPTIERVQAPDVTGQKRQIFKYVVTDPKTGAKAEADTEKGAEALVKFFQNPKGYVDSLGKEATETNAESTYKSAQDIIGKILNVENAPDKYKDLNQISKDTFANLELRIGEYSGKGDKVFNNMLRMAKNNVGGGTDWQKLAGVSGDEILAADLKIAKIVNPAQYERLMQQLEKPELFENFINKTLGTKPRVPKSITKESGEIIELYGGLHPNQAKSLISKLQTSWQQPQGRGAQATLEAARTHNKNQREAVYVGMQLVKDFNKLKIATERQELITLALTNPEKYLPQLTTSEQATYKFLKPWRDQVQKFAIDADLLDPIKAKENYMFNWWIDPKTNKPFNPKYGQFSKDAPQLKARVFQTREEGIAAGYKPATSNPAELINLTLQSLTNAGRNREFLKSIASIESDIPNNLFRSGTSKVAKPLRVIESWSKLNEQQLTDGYVKYSHDALSKPIVYKDSNGVLHSVKGDIGIQKDIFPYVKAYMEEPTFNNYDKFNFATKSLKLMSGFHIMSLQWQAVAGAPGLSKLPFYNVIKGLRQIEQGGENLRILYRNGLELKGFADIGGSHKNALEALAETKYGKIPGTILTATQKFTFDIVHPGIKTNTALHVYENMVKDLKASLNDGINEVILTQAQKEGLAHQTVKYVDRLYSGEDYKTAMLNSGAWMAKYFYSPAARKMWQRGLISPQWQKAHIGIVGDIGKAFTPKYWKNPESKLYRGYFYNALGIYGVANLYNFAMTKHMDGEGKFMFQNDGANAFSIRAPYNDPDGRKVYFRPLKSIFEVPELADDLVGRVIAKAAPMVAAIAGQIKPNDIMKYQGNDKIYQRVKDFAFDVAAPMSVPTVLNESKALTSKILAVIGIPTSKDYTKAEKLIFSYTKKSGQTTPEEEKSIGLRRAAKFESSKEFGETLRGAVKKGQITETGADNLWKLHKNPKLNDVNLHKVNGFKRLNIYQAIEVWQESTPEERDIFIDAFKAKAIKQRDAGLLSKDSIKEISTIVNKYQQSKK